MGYMDSGRLLPLTADGRVINLAHSFLHTQQSPQNPGVLRKGSQENHSSILIARASKVEQLRKKRQDPLSHGFRVLCKRPGRGKAARVEGAQYIRQAVGSSVQHGSSAGSEQNYGCDDSRFDQVSGISQIAGKARRFQGGDPIPCLNPRIQQYSFDLVENEPGKNE